MSLKMNLYKHMFPSRGWDAINITPEIKGLVEESYIKTGLVHVYAPGKRNYVVLTEYEPSLLKDLEELIKRFKAKPGVLDGLMNKSYSLPIRNGEIDLGVFKQIILVDLSMEEGVKEVVIVVEGVPR